MTTKDLSREIVTLVLDQCNEVEIQGTEEAIAEKVAANLRVALLMAHRHGMTKAAKCVTDGSFIHELSPESIMARSISKLILRERDTTTTLPE